MENRRRLSVRCLTALGFLLSFAAFLSLTADRWREPRLNFANVEPATSQDIFEAPKDNIWADLRPEEADEVYQFLAKEWADLNVTRTPRHALDNFIYTLETLQPNKSDALPWAKAVLSQGLDGRSHYSYHAVGPLPVSPETRVVPLAFPFTSGRNYVSKDMPDMVSTMEFALSLAENVADITTELLGAKVDRDDPNGPDSLLAFPRTTLNDAGHLFGWVQFFRPGYNSGALSILPQGIYARINAVDGGSGGEDADSDWKVGEWFYNGVMYDSLGEFRAAVFEPGFLKTPPNVDGSWTDTEDFDAHPDGRELPTPISIQPLGPRYKLDRKERYVSWFGFEFYFTSTQATGISIYDVRFKGQRVMYELSLQEAMAHYAGDDPMASGQEFLDSFFGMGTNAFELVPGYDCPGYADYLESSLHRLGKTERLPNNICLFEFTSDHLLSRHTTATSVTASRNTFLALRSVSTVGNYDYTIDYLFYLDGAIEVKVRASGYIFGAFYARNAHKNEDEYGHRIHDALSSSLHDHVISFKADLDIAGTANDMVRLAVEPVTQTYPWDQPHFKQRNTMHLREYPVERETGLDWPKNAGEFYLVYSSDQKNAWGERRGYRIVSGTGIGSTPHLTVLNSTILEDAARWAEKDLWVVRRKDTEPRGADPFNYIDPANPLVDFTRIADGEDLLHGHHEERDGDRDAKEASGGEEDYDGDLVVYFNVGSHHIPHSGDIPNTLMHTSASSVMFVPHNFADRDPSRESVQGVRLQLKHKRESGGFPGQPGGGGGGGGDEEANQEELRLRGREGEKGGHHKLQTGANYFGAPYREGINLPLKALEPDLEKDYRSGSHRVSDLSINGSAAGMWFKGP
ncbi:Primary amine oxidase- lung isozyme [Apiospora rasikravindrae]|uniref:Amine oxidase n=1 Tax=Apiospora rasikravindrae TaxID=990691 RepID=A0ABR1S0E7_9PEZI